MANILSQIGTAVAGKVTTLQSNIDSEASARASADSTLQSNIDSEASSRAQADSSLQSSIDSEVSSRTAADSTLQSNIDSEASTRAQADSSLQSSIDAEASSRASADSTLQSNIDSEASSRTAADSALQSSIDSEASSRTAADSTLQSNIDSLDSSKYDKSGGSIGGDVTIPGSLTVQGTTTAVESSNLNVTDAIVAVAKGGNGSSDAGLLVDCGGTNKFMGYNASTSKFEFLTTDATATSSDIDAGTHSGADVEVGALYIGANVLGEYSDFSSALG